LLPCIHPDESDILLHADGDWHRELQLFGYVVCQSH
jgi:hypothetical protein